MRISFKQIILCVVCLFCASMVYAKAFLIITPSITQTVIRSDSEKLVTFTVTNNTRSPMNTLTFYPAFQSTVNAAEIALQNNNCASYTSAAPFAPNASCTFQVLIQGLNQPSSFALRPRVCAYNNAVCSVPLATNVFNVSIMLITTIPRAYVGLISGSNINNIQSILTSDDSLGDLLPGFSFQNDFSTGISIGGSIGGRRVYISNDGTDQVIVVHTTPTLGITTYIDVADKPAGIAVLPDNTKAKAYVAIYGSDSMVDVIDTATNTIAKTISVGATSDAALIGVAASPDSAKIYVANGGENSIAVIDTNTDTVSATITTADVPSLNLPYNIAVSPDGRTLYVSNYNNGDLSTVSVINASTFAQIAAIPVGKGLGGITITPDGSKVFVANFGTVDTPGDSTTVSVIDTATNTVQNTITVGNNPPGVAVTPSGRKVYVTLRNENYVAVINTTTFAITDVNANGGQITIGAFVG